MSFADQLTLARAAAVPFVVLLYVAAGLGGLAAAGALDDTIAEWALVIALVLTWVWGLDYARLAPRLLRGDPTAGAARGAKSSESTFSSSPASRQTLP